MNAAHLGAAGDDRLRGARRRRPRDRGGQLHRLPRPDAAPRAVPFLGTVLGPGRFFFYNLFESDRTGAPLSWRNRAAGTIDAYAAAVGRWLVTRDGFDFLVYYLSDYDYASHAARARRRAARCSRAATRRSAELVRAAGGLDELARALRARRHVGPRPDARAPGRAARRALPDARRSARHRVEPRRAWCTGSAACRLDARGLAERLDGEPSVEVALFREGEDAVARREGEELRFAPDGAGWRARGRRLGARPARRRRARVGGARDARTPARCSSPPRDGWEFADLGGGHTSAAARTARSPPATREVPVLTVGVEGAVAEHRRRRAARARATSASRHRPTSAGRHDRASADRAATLRARMVERQLRRRGIATSACSPRWRGCRASSSSPSTSRIRVRRRGALDRLRARRSRSRSSWPRCASSSDSTATSGCSTSARVGVRGRGARGARRRGRLDRAHPRASRSSARAALAAGPPGGGGARRRRHARRARPRALPRDRGRAPRPARPAGARTSSSPRRPTRATARGSRAQRLVLVVRPRRGRRAASVAVPLRPARRRRLRPA